MSVQLPRRALLWVLGALVVAIMPHAPRLPVWILLAVGIALGWRYRVYQGRWSFPSRLVRFLLVLMAFTAVGLHWRTLNGLEPAVALLIIAGGLKCMELRSTRDMMVVCFVAYFLVASLLLFEQEIQHALYALVAIVITTAALVARHQAEPQPGFPSPLALAATMLAQALPLMLILFVVFPRLAPLWSLPQNAAAAKTGPGDTMSPGDVARLSASSELAFRVTFSGPVPAQRELYWRGLVFSEFDGREWRLGARARYELELAALGARNVALSSAGFVPSGIETGYAVILEPSNRQWAYAVGYPLSFGESLRMGSDYRLMTRTPVSQRLGYRVHADLGARLEPELGVLRRQTELQLPQGFNPRALAMARAWRAEEPSDSAYIERLLEWFNAEAFIYTLNPPLLGRDTVDEFLFGERRGFCEHFASAFVVLLRAAGIPARVVTGYQGGERNPFEDYLLVHQFDAHAWAEAWIAERGWVRFDPTAAVAPERIESSLGEVLGAEFLADSPLAMQRYRSIPLLGWIRMRWDLVTYHWARLVLQYDTERQMALLERLLGEISPVRLASALLAAGGSVLLLVTLSLLGWRKAPHHDPAARAYLLACATLAALGIARNRGEGPCDYGQRVAGLRPEIGPRFQAITADFVALGYAPCPGARRAAILRRLQGRVRGLRARVAAGMRDGS
ncbi:MAG: DUF3488 domain-containing transglutaminase family protein [Gammaproteobacteria bacterium]|nr:DUF3488 domain-containing transglutaminase family protein [Gammaproteobacteria bacterium]